VARLRVVQGPVRRPAAEKGARAAAQSRRRRAQPLDAAQEAALEASLAGAPDSPLKTALRKLGREVLRER
jgi:hypothetical protein